MMISSEIAGKNPSRVISKAKNDHKKIFWTTLLNCNIYCCSVLYFSEIIPFIAYFIKEVKFEDQVRFEF